MVGKFNSLLTKKSISVFEILVLLVGILAISYALAENQRFPQHSPSGEVKCGSEVKTVSGGII